MDRVANPKDIIHFFRHREQKEKNGKECKESLACLAFHFSSFYFITQSLQRQVSTISCVIGEVKLHSLI